MKRTFTIYNKATAPKLLLTMFPAAADNGEFYLFGNTLKAVSGTPAISVIDLASLGLNYPYAKGKKGLTAAKLNDKVSELLSEQSTGTEIQLSYEQGKLIYRTLFNPEQVTIAA